MPFQGEKLKFIQDAFNNVDIRFIDEKSMVGQKIFTIVIKRLQEARPHYNDKPFLNISVVLLGDINQQPTVCNSPLMYCLVLYWLFKANAVISSCSNLYTSFLTRPSPSPNLCDSKEQTKQTSGPNLCACGRYYEQPYGYDD